jgi:hypothetical protein
MIPTPPLVPPPLPTCPQCGRTERQFKSHAGEKAWTCYYCGDYDWPPPGSPLEARHNFERFEEAANAARGKPTAL